MASEMSNSIDALVANLASLGITLTEYERLLVEKAYLRGCLDETLRIRDTLERLEHEIRRVAGEE